jgi:P-type Mg2+ transporter
VALSPSSVLPKNIRTALRKNHGTIQVSPKVVRAASVVAAEVLAGLNSSATGLTEEQAQRRFEEFGPNVVASEERFTWLKLFVAACLNPLVILLSLLAIISFATAEDTSDVVSGILMVIMVILGVSLRFVQRPAPMRPPPSSRP